jgi:hypothetical protein
MSESIETPFLDSRTPKLSLNPRVPDEQIEYFHQRAGAVARAFPSLSDVLNGMRQVDNTVPDEAFLSFIEAGMLSVLLYHVNSDNWLQERVWIHLIRR